MTKIPSPATAARGRDQLIPVEIRLPQDLAAVRARLLELRANRPANNEGRALSAWNLEVHRLQLWVDLADSQLGAWRSA